MEDDCSMLIFAMFCYVLIICYVLISNVISNVISAFYNVK